MKQDLFITDVNYQCDKPDDCALVLFSGGQDSTATLLWALDKFSEVYLMGFHYGQRHVVELDIRMQIISQITKNQEKIKGDKIIDLAFLSSFSQSSLVTEASFISDNTSNIPNSFVPGRNIIFLTIAAAFCYEKKINHICAGMSEVDYSGYPDCRQECLAPLIEAINRGMDYDLKLCLPAINLSKSQIWQLIEQKTSHDFTKQMIELTHSCYRGNRDKQHFWGYGCGDCPACKLRIKGCQEYLSGKDL